MVKASGWKALKVKPKELCISTTLNSGQTFRWRKTGEAEWIPSSIVHTRRREEGKEGKGDVEELLTDYFQLKVDLDECYRRWNSIDKNFANKSEHFLGIRILRQDPVENLISFICTSNNNIKRISQMVEKLCAKYGRYKGTINEVPFYAFPELELLTGKEVEVELRNLGFGYRAKFVRETAKSLVELHPDPKDWLLTLREAPYSEAHTALLKLPGVGAKVADCVCLMSLDKHEAVPVDTHVWQIAKRDYGFLEGKAVKSLTPKIYAEVGDHFRNLFGDYSGWAHSVLFTADLKEFGERMKKRATTKDDQVEEKKVKVTSGTTLRRSRRST
ncbi:DNA glycosylase [Basidiobolus meristosporus CBS 931.73]|uniref:N-glycosylase/DNA lyase n=1 Tax=Basidiobolus meristosporus CBS 931.73 TaxID=1314790 RepID=A0A1Y1YT83_9FUNG|nr:DNA glycosylase [Basidiobolus meristosporus CBS 931.73]|eukprot:ORY01248.1 DNA glycosylase [Basidiobolus meristosporus CBS 931.73]